MAPRDDLQTIDWRLRHDLTEQPEPGCIVADHAGFYSILAASAVAGSGHGDYRYALLNWFQGLVAAILPAHERAKNGCAYGMMQKTFAPQEMSSYDNVDYYKEYYGVIIVRTLLFLVGLIWMQHLMVRRVLAVETTSRRYLGGKCLATNIAVQKVAAIVACGVSVWIYTSLDDEAAASLHFLGHVSFWQRCSQCTYFVGLLFFQLILGGLNVILFIGTAVTVLVVMRIILRDLSKALVVTNEFAQTHPRTRRAGQQLKRARTVVRRQLAGVALNVLASFGVVPLAVKTILDGRGYISEQELALRTAAQVLDIASCVAAALILSGGYRRPVEGRKVPVSQGDAAEPCTCQFATLESVPLGRSGRSNIDDVSGLLRSSSAWKAKVMDLAERGVTVRELLSFYRNLKTVMPHFRPSIHTTHDVVRHAIIPMTKHKKTSYVQAFSERVQQPGKMVTSTGRLRCRGRDMEGRRLPERRRVGALLNAYYHIEGTEKKDAPGSTGSDLDRQGFDAKRSWATQRREQVAPSAEAEAGVSRHEEGTERTVAPNVEDLDGDMQMLVYENYSKFIRATDVIKQMKFTIEGLDPDLKVLEGNVEDGVSGRAGEIEGLLKQQRICRKLQVLFELPSTLQKCLDRKAYGEAVEAYCCCSGFLRQHMPTFQKVLEEVELQMGRIRVALEERLRSPELSVDEAVNSSVTLLDLGEDQVKVVSEYLTGRTATLRRSLSDCFAPSAADAPAVEGELTKDQEELRRPESMALHTACGKATEAWVASKEESEASSFGWGFSGQASFE
eukprot:g17658.t1